MSFFQQPQSIRSKLILLTLGISLSALIFTCISYIIYDRITFKQKMVRDLETLSDIIGGNCEAALAFYDPDSAAKTLETLRAEKHILAAAVFNNTNQRFAVYRQKTERQNPLPSTPSKSGYVFQDRALVLFRPIYLENEKLGTIYLHSDLTELDARLTRFLLIVALLISVASLGAYFLASRLQKMVSAPILHLSEVAREISEKQDFSIRAESRGGDETGFLIERFNDMVGQIEERDKALRMTQNELELKYFQLEVQLSERTKAEEALKQARDELESRVVERTADLAKANADLTNEVAEREKTALELERAKEAAEAANQAKSEFLANMSHELRTPLNHIIGFNELVLDKNYGDLNPTQEEFLNDVLQSSRHLLALINDILDLSKVEAGKMELEVSPLYLRSLLESSLIMVKEKAHKHQIKLLTFLEGLPEMIRADERKLKQILYNLLSNALKFTPDGGTVRLECKTIADCGEKPQTWLEEIESRGSNDEIRVTSDEIRDIRNSPSAIRISVSDTGIGLEEKDLERIFEPFEQADNSASRKFQGTGLGLSLSKQMVELHGGRIWAESKGQGQGSVFHFILPVDRN
ncbi:MAG: ATP-binding protein [Thermodesulfobacteriota bacterium]